MSTLTEIEAAAAKLPAEQQAELIRFLAAQQGHPTAATVIAQRSQRGFPISKGAVAFGSAEVAHIEHETDRE